MIKYPCNAWLICSKAQDSFRLNPNPLPLPNKNMFYTFLLHMYQAQLVSLQSTLNLSKIQCHFLQSDSQYIIWPTSHLLPIIQLIKPTVFLANQPYDDLRISSLQTFRSKFIKRALCNNGQISDQQYKMVQVIKTVKSLRETWDADLTSIKINN